MRPATALPLPWGPAYDGAGSFLSDGMEWNWRGCGFDFAFLHWTLGFRQPLHQSGNQKTARPNDDDSLRELPLWLREILQNTLSRPGTCALGNGRCQRIKASSTYTNLNVSSLAIWPTPQSTRKNEGDRCYVMDFSEIWSIVHELPVW